MRKTLVVLALLAAATTATAQVSRITTDRRAGDSWFSIGPRLSNYSTHFDAGLTSLKTGRQTGFGVVGDYRAGAFVLDFMWDRDPENGIQLSDIIVDFGNYERDRGEVTVGFAIAPNLDLQGGIHYDEFRLGGGSFFGNDFGSDLSVQHEALVAGITLHNGDLQPVGFSLAARGLLGTADLNLTGPNTNDVDTRGFRAEANLSIRIGESQWYAVPGIEYEKITSDEDVIDVDTNRLFIKFVYRTRR